MRAHFHAPKLAFLLVILLYSARSVLSVPMESPLSSEVSGITQVLEHLEDSADEVESAAPRAADYIHGRLDAIFPYRATEVGLKDLEDTGQLIEGHKSYMYPGLFHLDPPPYYSNLMLIKALRRPRELVLRKFRSDYRKVYGDSSHMHWVDDYQRLWGHNVWHEPGVIDPDHQDLHFELVEKVRRGALITRSEADGIQPAIFEPYFIGDYLIYFQHINREAVEHASQPPRFYVAGLPKHELGRDLRGEWLRLAALEIGVLEVPFVLVRDQRGRLSVPPAAAWSP